MQNILLTAKGLLKLGGFIIQKWHNKSKLTCFVADFGMARPYSSRPLTPGVVTIWYRAPEILLGTKYYLPSVDLWSAGLVLTELLLSTPCVTGDTPVEQLSLIVKLIGSPSPDDMAALSAMKCPELIRWRRESSAVGRADNLERKFLVATSPETVNFLRGLLSWNPHARWTATEALGLGKGQQAVTAENWWKERPRAVEKELLPTFPEVRNTGQSASTTDRKIIDAQQAGDMELRGGGYIFDFGTGYRRPAKRPRAN